MGGTGWITMDDGFNLEGRGGTFKRIKIVFKYHLNDEYFIQSYHRKRTISLCNMAYKNMKTSYLNILNLSLFISCTFKVPIVVFVDVSEEFYTFAAIAGPFRTSFLVRPIILNTPC